MADPPRLQDDTDDLLIVEMLAAARSETPHTRTFNKTFLAVGSAAGLMGGQATAGAASSFASASLVKLAAKWMLLSTVVVGGGVTATEVLPRLVATPSVETRPPPAEHERASAPVAERTRAVTRGTNPDPVATEPTTDSAALVGQPKHASPEERLAIEVALLDRARLALARGDFDRVASLSAQYLVSYPHGRLEQEARYLEMEAERARGHRREAEREAERLLDLNPSGPHARAAREVLK
jgi:hypothetical protein